MSASAMPKGPAAARPPRRTLIPRPRIRSSTHSLLVDIVRAMAVSMTDAELKEAMKHIAKVAGLNLSDERIERDLAAFKGHLAAIEKIRSIDLPIEAEPVHTFRLKLNS